MTLEIKGRRGGLTPLARSGAGLGSGGRADSVPGLVTGRLTNSVSWFEDFQRGTVAPAASSNFDPGGYFNWLATELGGGTTGTVGLQPAQTGQPSQNYGFLGLATGATNGNGMLVDYAGVNGTTTGYAVCGLSIVQPLLFMSRFQLGDGAAITTSIRGIGLVSSSVNVGTDWMTDPDTTFAILPAVIIRRDPSAYAGTTAGALVLHVYNTFTVLKLELVAAPSASTYYKVEATWEPVSGTVTAYVNGALVTSGTIAAPGSAASLRPSVGIVMTTASAVRRMAVDCMFHELAQASAR